MSIVTLLIIILIIAFLGGFGWQRENFVMPGGIIGTILVVLLVLLVLGYVR